MEGKKRQEGGDGRRREGGVGEYCESVFDVRASHTVIRNRPRNQVTCGAAEGDKLHMVTFFWVEPATGGDIIGGDNDWRLAIFEDSPFSVDFLSHLVEFLLKIHTEHAVCLVEDQVFQRAQIEPLGMVT